MKLNLSERVRANSEAAPWVIDEIKAMEKELEQLHAGLERVKTASVCPVDVRSMWVHESHGSLTVYCRTGESAKQLEKWISDSIKKRNEKWT